MSTPISRAHFLRTVMPGAAAVTCLAANSALAAESAGPLSGVFKYVGGSRQRARLDAAIEDVVSQMNFMVRGIARSRLQDGLQPKPLIKLDVRSSHARLVIPGVPDVEGPLDGSPCKWRSPEGELMTLRLRHDGNVLDFRYVGSGGGSRMTYRFNEDASRVQLRSAVDHQRLPGTIRYSLSYARA